MHRHSVKLRPFITATVLTMLYFQDAIEKWISIFKYFDEIICVIFAIYFTLMLAKKRISRHDSLIIICTMFLVITGLVGNGRSNLGVGIKYILYDIFNVIKYTFIVLGAPHYFSHYKYKREVISYLTIGIKIVVTLSSLLLVLNLVSDIGMHTDYRFGLRAYRFVFSRVGGLYGACVIWLIILLSHLQFTRNKRNDWLYIILVMINMCSTLRTRALTFSLLFLMIYYYCFVLKKLEFKWKYVIPFAVLAYLIAREQIAFYFSGDRARNVLVRYGLSTASEFFPTGSGFATYGTAVARDIYSPLYSRYGFSKYWGLSSEFGAFLTDNYWPAIIGQFGYIGLVINVMLLFGVYQKLHVYAQSKNATSGLLFAFGTLIISSMASSSFFACSQLMVFVCLIVTVPSTIKK